MSMSCVNCVYRTFNCLNKLWLSASFLWRLTVDDYERFNYGKRSCHSSVGYEVVNFIIDIVIKLLVLPLIERFVYVTRERFKDFVIHWPKERFSSSLIVIIKMFTNQKVHSPWVLTRPRKIPNKTDLSTFAQRHLKMPLAGDLKLLFRNNRKTIVSAGDNRYLSSPPFSIEALENCSSKCCYHRLSLSIAERKSPIRKQLEEI